MAVIRKHVRTDVVEIMAGHCFCTIRISHKFTVNRRIRVLLWDTHKNELWDILITHWKIQYSKKTYNQIYLGFCVTKDLTWNKHIH